MSKVIRIGTRESELALWQANTVKSKLEAHGHSCELIKITSQGDQQLEKPLYELGIVGVFTKTLDIALLNNQIDIAVHSMKDVPTSLPRDLVQAAVLERGNTQDILVHKGQDLSGQAVIATGSLRRKAQWLNKYPKHQVVGLRGNVNTRLKKLAENPWDGAIFAKAGLERINLLPKNHTVLDWMVPAPAQGAIMIMARLKDTESQLACRDINHTATQIATLVEREFLQTLEGGCTAPIGAHCKVQNGQLFFKGSLHSLDGTKALTINKTADIANHRNLGKMLATQLLKEGGAALMAQIKKEL